MRKLPPAHRLVFEDSAATVAATGALISPAKSVSRTPGSSRAYPRASAPGDPSADGRGRAIGSLSVSGGMDPFSAVVAAMAEVSSSPVKTFSIGFESEAFDELGHARRISDLFGTEHQEFVVRPDAIEMLSKVVRQYGEPFSDPSAIPAFYLSELTRSKVTVALNGDGGDESFGGYTRYVANRLGARLDRLPLGLRRALAASAGRLGGGDLESVSSKARRPWRGCRSDRRGATTGTSRGSIRRDAVELYDDGFAETVANSPGAGLMLDTWRQASGEDVIDVMLEVDSMMPLPGNLIPKIDIATMAYALEARSPLLDHELMEFAASIPAELKVRGSEKKWIFRQALRGWLPDEILDRPKQGFTVPIGEWFRNDLHDLVRDVLLDPGTLERGYFRPQVVRSMLERHMTGDDTETKPLWALLMFELWHREFVDSSPMPATLATTAA